MEIDVAPMDGRLACLALIETNRPAVEGDGRLSHRDVIFSAVSVIRLPWWIEEGGGQISISQRRIGWHTCGIEQSI